MKLYEVKYEADGRTIKEPGVTETEIKVHSLFFAAETPEQVWLAAVADGLMTDPERRFRSMAEVLPLVTVLPENGSAP